MISPGLVDHTLCKNLFLKGMEAELFDLVITDAMEAFSHKFHGTGNVVKDTDLFLKGQFFFCQFHENIKLFFTDLIGTEGFQGIYIELSLSHPSKETFHQNPVFQIFAPGYQNGGVCQAEGFFQ